jgi:hypothetical protein
MDSSRPLKLIVTLGALSLVLAHLIWPSLAIDGITLGLVAIAIIPWLAPLVKSLEFPGGWKVELREMKAATERAKEAGLLERGPNGPQPTPSFLIVAESDPNLALAGLRIELERRLVTLCEAREIQPRSRGMSQLLRTLGEHGVLTSDQRAALDDLTGLLNSAVHGAAVEPRAAEWALRMGPDLLESLNRMIAPDGPKVFVTEDEPKFAHDGDIWFKPPSNAR